MYIYIYIERERERCTNIILTLLNRGPFTLPQRVK